MIEGKYLSKPCSGAVSTSLEVRRQTLSKREVKGPPIVAQHSCFVPLCHNPPYYASHLPKLFDTTGILRSNFLHPPRLHPEEASKPSRWVHPVFTAHLPCFLSSHGFTVAMRSLKRRNYCLHASKVCLWETNCLHSTI
jgi:hypothetical protein